MSANPLRELRVVRMNATCRDESLDVANMSYDDISQYVLTREDRHLKFLEGRTGNDRPVWFVIKRLPGTFLTRTLDEVYPLAERRTLAFKAACHRIEFADPDGSNAQVVKSLEEHPLVVMAARLAGKREPYAARDGQSGTDIAPDSFVQAVMDLYGAETIQEMGQVAIDLARLPVGKAGPFGLWVGSVANG